MNCEACGQACHCGRLYTSHRCGVVEGALDLSTDTSGTCSACGVSAGVANVKNGLCVSRVMCSIRVRRNQRGGGR